MQHSRAGRARVVHHSVAPAWENATRGSALRTPSPTTNGAVTTHAGLGTPILGRGGFPSNTELICSPKSPP